MTDRISHLTVSLDADMRSDDVEALVQAIGFMRGVGEVRLGKPVSMDDHIARQRIGGLVAQQLFEIGHALLRGDDPRAPKK